MDTESLKTELTKVIESFEHEGKPLDFVGLVPVAPGAYNTQYVLQVSSPFLKSGADGLHLIIEKLFQLVPVEGRRLISSIKIYDPQGSNSTRLLYANDDLILVNRLNYKPDPMAFYEFMTAEN